MNVDELYEHYQAAQRKAIPMAFEMHCIQNYHTWHVYDYTLNEELSRISVFQMPEITVSLSFIITIKSGNHRDVDRSVVESITFPASLVDDPDWKRTWLRGQLAMKSTPKSILQYLENELECLL